MTPALCVERVLCRVARSEPLMKGPARPKRYIAPVDALIESNRSEGSAMLPKQ